MQNLYKLSPDESQFAIFYVTMWHIFMIHFMLNSNVKLLSSDHKLSIIIMFTVFIHRLKFILICMSVTYICEAFPQNQSHVVRKQM